MPIDTFSKVPLYYQIQKEIELRINQHWTADEKIPSESELMEEFNVSRNTVKKAIEELVIEGKLYRIQGKGTFVCQQQVTQSLSSLYSFSNSFKERGIELKNQLLSVQVVSPTEMVIRALQLPPHTQEVIELKRLRKAEGKPVILETSYFNKQFVTEIEPFEQLVSKRMYGILSEYFGINITYADETFEAVNLTASQAEALQVNENDAAIYLERIAQDERHRIIEYCQSYVRKGDFKFTIKLT